MTQTGRLAGKVAVITGAANGIGRATAERFAREGAKLLLNDQDEAALSSLVARLGGAAAGVAGLVADVSHDPDVKRIMQAALSAHGRIDILVANAGIIPEARLSEATSELWDQVMAVDGRGMFLCCKHAAAQMLEQERIGEQAGSIVCLSSISAFAGQVGQAVYGPAKFVASGITTHLAIELAPQGIRVNAVAPGTIDTPAVAKMDKARIEATVARHPLGRIGRPEEIAAAILFLASDDASFVTGAVLPVDGGYLAQ